MLCRLQNLAAKFRVVRVEHISVHHAFGPSAIVKRANAGLREVKKIINADKGARGELWVDTANYVDGEDITHAGLLKRCNVGTVVDQVRWN